jgi:hypothetical protein
MSNSKDIKQNNAPVVNIDKLKKSIEDKQKAIKNNSVIKK